MLLPGRYIKGWVFVPQDTLGEAAQATMEAERRSADTKASTKPRQSGEPQTKTIEGWKKDYDSVVHFLLTEKRVEDAARKAALATPRPWATIARNYYRYKRDYLDRQNGKSPNA